MLFFRSKLRSRLDFVKPSVAGTIRRSQDAQQQCRQQHSRDRWFTVVESVLVRDYRKGEDKWTHCVILEKTGPVLNKVNVGAQGVWKRHVDQMLTRPESGSQQVTVDPPTSSQMSPAQSGSDTMLHPCTSLQEETVEQVLGTTSPPETPQSLKPAPTDCTQVRECVRRYPVRVTKPPARYRDG
uniref:Uncharacterized protein n=1 Tax=Nothobranchius furzeri TaxID=105023 RepID=A0A1A7ZK95_NOTFU